MMIRDIMGKEIRVGDLVTYAVRSKRGGNLRVGQIDRIAVTLWAGNEMVKVRVVLPKLWGTREASRLKLRKSTFLATKTFVKIGGIQEALRYFDSIRFGLDCVNNYNKA